MTLGSGEISSRRAVLFGGSGFIGRHLTIALAEQGYEVVIADIRTPGFPLPSNVTFQRCDVRERITVSSAGTVDLVVNLAAIHRTPGHKDHEYFDTNVPGAVNVSDWCREKDARTVVFLSSISVYGPDEEHKTESTVPTPTTAYGSSKLQAEEAHRAWLASVADGQLLVVRPAAIFGVGEGGNFTRLAAAMQRRRFAYPGRENAVKSCGYVGDLVDAIVFALGLGERELTMNFCYPQRVTLGDVCRAYADTAGYPLPHRIPKAVVRTAIGTERTLNRLGVEIRVIERAMKLVQSTDIGPDVLVAHGFVWNTDLLSGIQSWCTESATGRFE
ncbi:MAG TPA: NAD(P)-dependent oxidoreductase [Mycobacteriales bacterium]|nr:NAD(P)-dependent oxidoreductase [Mycobacteriales bacterium]